MSRKTANLTPLQIRKQMLIIESELNRTQLVADWGDVKKAVDHFGSQVSTVTTLAESAVKVGASVAQFFQGFSGSDGDDQKSKRSSWFSTAFDLAKRGFSLWRSR